MRRTHFVLVDPHNAPKMVLNSDEFIRDALFNRERYNPYWHCDRPVITRLRVKPEHSQDDVVDHDVILLWNKTLRIITGGDILGRLLRGIVQNPAVDRGIASNSKGAGTE